MDIDRAAVVALDTVIRDDKEIVSTDSLRSLVTAAIRRAEHSEEHGVGSTSLAWAEVSALEEKLAVALPVSQPEGRIARRGAVRAALKAGNQAQAHNLAQKYLAEEGTPKDLRAALAAILKNV